VKGEGRSQQGFHPNHMLSNRCGVEGCGYTTTSRTALEKHENEHILTCPDPTCPFTTTSPEALATHELTHAPPTISPPSSPPPPARRRRSVARAPTRSWLGPPTLRKSYCDKRGCTCGKEHYYEYASDRGIAGKFFGRLRHTSLAVVCDCVIVCGVVCVCVCVCTPTLTQTRTHVHTHLHTHARTHTHAHARTRTHARTQSFTHTAGHVCDL